MLGPYVQKLGEDLG